MPTTHLLAGDHQVGLGACSNRYNGIPVLGAPAVHFPNCDPGDCYCLTPWTKEQCERHEYVALSRRVVLCARCKALPEQPLTHGQLKHARDLARAERKRVVAVRYSRAAVAFDRRLVALNDAIAAATSAEDREAALARLRAAVARYDQFGLRAS